MKKFDKEIIIDKLSELDFMGSYIRSYLSITTEQSLYETISNYILNGTMSYSFFHSELPTQLSTDYVECSFDNEDFDESKKDGFIEEVYNSCVAMYKFILKESHKYVTN